MKILNGILTLSIVVSVCGTQAVNISGTVKGSDGNGLKGVKVYLGKAGIKTESASDGSFTLKDGTEVKRLIGTVFGSRTTFFVKDDRIYFRPGESLPVTVTIHDCKGRVEWRGVYRTSEGGASMSIPYMAAGIHIYRISIGDKNYTTGRIVGMQNDKGCSQLHPPFASAGFQERAAGHFDDALLFIKEGYKLSRVVVTNPETTALEVKMQPLDTGTVKDVEGNVYRTVRIGNQEWMAENLRTTKYNDGSSIGSGCHFYNNITDAAAKKKWGALYTQSAAKSGKLAPSGWHLPTNADWDTLKNYLISHGYNYDGTTSGNKIAKALASTTDWEPSSETGAIGNDLSLNNASGFSALPAGWRYWGNNQFEQQKLRTYWWTATQQDATYTCVRDLWYINFDIDETYYTLVECSVRLVKDK